ncbi:MAG TPA: enoyl-CoA hydratase [Pseudomonadales bacterium]
MSRVTIETGIASDHLLAWEEDGIAVLTLNRPEARNAMSADMNAGLARALDYAERSPSVRCVVLTGAGGAFCAGGDVKGMAGRGDAGSTAGAAATLDERIHAQRLNQRATAGRMFLMPKPVIASLPGPAAGAGLSLALAADLRIMADTAFITSAFARVGFSGDYGGTFFLTQIVGTCKAREIYYLSDRVSAEECLRLGIANQVVPAAELEAATMALARRLADGPPVAYRYMKENLNRAATGADVLECLDLEATHHVHTGLTEDHREAAKAFVEKRTPVFHGR